MVSADIDYEAESYKVWAFDNQVYGPITLPVLLEWVQESRVDRGSWIYLERREQWIQAKKLDPLHGYFPAGETTVMLHRHSAEASGVGPEDLRQFTVLAGLSNHELSLLAQLGELVLASAGQTILQRQQPGDALYFVLSGSVRAFLRTGADERVLATIPAGQFFGEIAMFTQSPRTADVVAAEETRLLRFSAAAFQALISRNPSAAAPMLFSITQTMAHRILEDDKRLLP
jgi:hypothetical protein